MKDKLFLCILAALLLLPVGRLAAQEYEYPFQNPALSEDERLDNVISMMTIDEKLGTIVGQGVPRLGIANPGAAEAIHADRGTVLAPASPTSIRRASSRAYWIRFIWSRSIRRISCCF